ncbi:MAG: trehalase family glycosidase, partial [Gemmatimonadales bacterium]
MTRPRRETSERPERDASDFPADRLAALTRTDKWFLSCGDGIVWAPPHPGWLHRPGFWDEALVYYHPFAPLFSVALVDGDGQDGITALVDRAWQPDRLVLRWRTVAGVDLVETRTARSGGRFASVWTRADGAAWWEVPFGDHALIAFSAQPGPDVAGVSATEPGLTWQRTLYDRRDQPLPVRADLAAVAASGDSGASSPSRRACRAEGGASPAAPPPQWDHTPFWDAWDGDAGSDEIGLEGLDEGGLVWLAVARRLADVDAWAGFELTVVATPLEGTTPSVIKGAAPHAQHPHDDAREQWTAFFDDFPRFRCSDPFLERYYEYRLYGLGLNRLAGESGNVRHPAVAEGIGYFHVPISYSAQGHMRELRWARSGDAACGSLLNFLDAQQSDGSLPGRIYTNHSIGTDFYHANWGDALLAVDAGHDDPSFLDRAYRGLGRYADWLDATRDADDTGMYDVVNHYETGQEYMSRYQVVADDADRAGWAGGLRLKGIDVTVYAHQLKRALATAAERLGRTNDVARWRDGAARIAEAIRQAMWDPELQFFTDVDPRSGERTRVVAAVGFYPLLTDLLDASQVSALLQYLNDPAWFATPYPIPSSPVRDPYFDPNARWKGKRHHCPWNGRVWPMVNSHVIEGLLRQWHAGVRSVGPTAVRLLERFVKMMFHDGDLERPNCYEHYHPFTGRPSVYRGIDDYQHSWVLDLLIRGVAALEPTGTGILIDPLP